MTVRSLSPTALAAVALWGGSFVAVRLALPAFPPFVLVALRLALGAATLALVQVVRGRKLWPSRDALPRTVLLGAIFAGHVSIQAYGLAHTSAIHTGWLIGFAPVTIALGARVYLGERLRPIAWGGIAVATAGVLVVTLEELPDFSQARFGDFLALTSCFTWTLYTLLAAPVVSRVGPLPVAFTAMLSGGVLLVPVAAAGWDGVSVPTTSAWLALLFLGLGCSGFASLLWLHGQERDGAAKAGAMLYFEPFVTLALALVLLEETPGRRAALGGLLVLLGVYGLSRGRGAAGE